MRSTDGNDPVIVVSGLPRSGTSMMMRMLDAVGVPIVADHLRESDIDNPNGYYEFEPVKQMKESSSWLDSAGGSAVKVIYLLLYDLPLTHDYQVIFMNRNLNEVLSSQDAMLKRLGTTPAQMPNNDELKWMFETHLGQIRNWLREHPNFSVLELRYDQVIKDPFDAATRLSEFLGGGFDVEKMAATVDPALYRQRADAIGAG